MRYFKAIIYRLNHLTHAHLWFRKKDFGSKIFCIGYNKTGTTSVGDALREMGFRHSSFNKKVWRQFYRNGQTDKIINYTAKFESLDDLPWLLKDMFPVMDKTFPGSKFIFLVREEEAWKKSFYNWRYKLFGEYPDLDQAVADYRDHNQFVMEYFKDRPAEDFIVLDVKDPEAYKKLANFVGRETDKLSLPRSNQTSNLKTRKPKH